MALLERLRRAWTVFSERQEIFTISDGGSSRPTDRSSLRLFSLNDRSLVTSVYNRLALDVSGVLIKHVTLDDKGRYKADAGSQLNDCLTIQPNLDQAPSDFRQDIAMTLFDKGSAALVPIVSERDDLEFAITDVSNIRVGDVTEWFKRHVRVNVWNESEGRRQEIIIEKRLVALVYNPLAPVMNEPNSTLQRLIRKLGLLDIVDEASSSGKLDLIIQLPYVVKSEARKQQAQQRRDQIEFQLKGSQYGIAYTDATEKITQLNRPAENNLLKQVEYLVGMLYGQLGLTPEVMNGTADEAAMINYYARTVYPIVNAIVEAMRRSYIISKVRSKKEDIRYFREPFKFVPLSQFAEIADKFRRNEIMTSNEIRDVIGLVPITDDKQADQLSNPNMPDAPKLGSPPVPQLQNIEAPKILERTSQNGS